jgi:hypothetical protein
MVLGQGLERKFPGALLLYRILRHTRHDSGFKRWLQALGNLERPQSLATCAEGSAKGPPYLPPDGTLRASRNPM